jgi:hypothetical protein
LPLQWVLFFALALGSFAFLPKLGYINASTVTICVVLFLQQLYPSECRSNLLLGRKAEL